METSQETSSLLIHSSTSPSKHPKITKTKNQISTFEKLKSNWFAFIRVLGPGFVVAIGYMDPGNWATCLDGGSKYGYTLLSVILLSNIMAIFLQILCVRLGVVTGKDLAQACKSYMNPYLNIFMYVLAELAIIATDLAEVIGGAIALKLLFNIELPVGIVITCIDVFLILLLWRDEYQKIFEFIIFLVVLIVGVCFAILVDKTDPNWTDVGKGYVPTLDILKNGRMLYSALGILGATVMPHNLYIHSHFVKDKVSDPLLKELKFDDVEDDDNDSDQDIPRAYTPSVSSFIEYEPSQIALRVLETIFALSFAVLVNSAILIVAAAAFHEKGETDVGEIPAAFYLLDTFLGHFYAIVFAVALLLCSQSSTITGTIAGQVVMEGHLGQYFKIRPWVRKLITRLFAIVPAMAFAFIGDKGISDLLVLSQVVLSFQLPFAVWPLVYFTSNKSIMTNTRYSALGQHQVSWSLSLIGSIIALILTILNIILIYQYFTGVSS